MKRKLTLGKKTMRSVEIQVGSILRSIHKAEVSVKSIKPVRFHHGIYFRVSYHASDEPDTPHCRYFGHQKFRDCCDVWLESPTILSSGSSGGSAA